MHELSITENILRIALERTAAHGVGRLSYINVKVGRLTSVEPESLEFYFKVLAAETPAAHATLRIEVVPVRLCCRRCQCEFEAAPDLILCSRCGSSDVEILTGRELQVESIEVD